MKGWGGGVRILKVAATPLSGWFLSIQIFGAPSPLSPIFFSELPFQVSNNFRSPPRYLHPPPLVILNELSLIHNFRSLFSPYPGRSVPGPSSSARNNFYRPPPPKKPKKTDFFQLKETWTHDFFRVASKPATIVPAGADNISLQNTGLGRRKFFFFRAEHHCISC